jgi:hypothetical protein
MFTRVAANWGAMTDEERKQAVLIADRQGQIGIMSEPEDWRIHLTLARVYQLAAPFNSSFIDEARSLVDRAGQLAPERIEVVQMQVMQQASERKFDVALGAIDEYLKKNPAAGSFFAGLRNEIEEAAGR